ncbi:MAG: hypothetical protein COB23_09700 [Methylophaga sp.]|nr:MAG: hypothetical protein COB23_09700 [Methylophaga sp.]
MAQDIFLKTEGILTPSKQDVNVAAQNTVSSGEEADYKDFSSELNKQIDRRDKHDNDDENASAVVKHEDKAAKSPTEKAEDIRHKSGNKLPGEVDEHGLNTKVEVELTTIVDDDLIENELNIEAEVTNVPVVAPLALVVEDKVKSVSKTTAQLGEQAKNSPQQNTLPQHVLKSVVDADQIKAENNKSEVPQKNHNQPTSLRPDILNALAGKSEKQNAKFSSVIVEEQVLKTEKSKGKAFTEGQQLAELIKQVKPGQVLPVPTRDTAPSNLFSASASQPNATAAVQSSPVLTMQPVVQSEAWNLVLSNRVTWMAREGVQRAVLQLNPANLGPVEVKLHIKNDQATVTFTAQHALTRDALEQALPRLRDSLQENNLELVKAEVNQQSSGQEDKQETEQEDGTLSTQHVEGMAGEDSDSGGTMTITSDDTELGLSLYV